MNERIDEICKACGISARTFAERLNVSPGLITNMKKGRNAINDRIIAQISKEFNVNEEWFRTGNGSMFIETPDSILAQLARERKMSPLETKIMEAYLTLPAETRDAIMHKLIDIVNSEQEAPAVDPIDAEVEAYRRELEAEKGEQSPSAATAAPIKTG